MVIENISGNFFEEKNILVTGHTGFIGSWLSINANSDYIVSLLTT